MERLRLAPIAQLAGCGQLSRTLTTPALQRPYRLPQVRLRLCGAATIEQYLAETCQSSREAGMIGG